MHVDILQGRGDDGRSYTVLRTTPKILGSGLEGMPTYRLEDGALLVPTAEPDRFRIPGAAVVITIENP